MSYDPATVAFELSGAEAWALAQFVVRVGWEVPETPSNQELREALAKLQEALRDQGYAPRWEALRLKKDVEKSCLKSICSGLLNFWWVLSLF